MIEPDNAGKRRKECDVAGPLFRELLQQLARRIFRSHDFRYQKRHRDREHAIAECLEPIGFGQSYVRPERFFFGPGYSAHFLLGGRRAYQQAKSA